MQNNVIFGTAEVNYETRTRLFHFPKVCHSKQLFVLILLIFPVYDSSFTLLSQQILPARQADLLCTYL